MKTEFSKCLENIFTWNTKAEKFTFITFCAVEQLSVFIHELKKNLGIPNNDDDEEHNPLYRGSVSEMVWVKTKHFAQGKIRIYCSRLYIIPISCIQLLEVVLWLVMLNLLSLPSS
jgi:hypothetical protein